MTAPLMLGVSGLRGVMGESLTPEVAARYAAAFGSWLRERHSAPPRVILSRDGRAGGHAIALAAIAGLNAAGCAVTDLGIAATPTAGVMVDHLRATAAMIVTASHNPQEWNGLKCLVPSGTGGVDAAAPDARAAEDIIARFRSGVIALARWPQVGDYTRLKRGGVAEHVSRVCTQLEAAGLVTPASPGGPAHASHVGAGRRVVLDSVNGSGAVAGAELLQALGCSVVHVGDAADGLFPHPPEPLRENLVGLSGAVREYRADAGFAQDPDADRLAIIDERGHYLGEEYTLALAAESILGGTALQSRPPGPADAAAPLLVTNLSTSRMLDDVAARHGARVLRTPVGEANVVEAMKREARDGRAILLGGEGNGGVIWPRVTYVRDSLSGMALVLALMARTGKPLSALAAELPSYAIEKRKVDLPRRDDAAPAIEKLAVHWEGERHDRQDGIRIDFEARRAWLHVRPSNTEPVMRLIAEAPDAAAAKGILDEAARVIG